MENSKGSEWRRWDLHLHTASSYDYKYKCEDADELLCKALRENNIYAVAITDHFQIDAKRIRHLRELAPEIVFFPGVELRTDKGSNNLHFNLIFSDQMDIDILQSDFEAIMLREKAKSPQSYESIYWVFEDAIEFCQKRKGLLSIHAGKKTNGLDQEISNGVPYREALKEDIAQSVDFFEIGKKKDVEDYRKYVFSQIEEKPLIIGSDNHDPRNYVVKENLWIKADITFEGLKQCLFQPRERVYVGEIPLALDRERKMRSENIACISVKRKKNPVFPDMNWFDFTLPLNSGLIAVIGNKGSGKSAFSDIIGQLCKCHTMEKAAFLNEKRFRRQQKNFSQDYEASIAWGDGHESTIDLSVKSFDTIIEDARYLPQQYIEDVCNDIGNGFQQEIDRVVFSYVDPTERAGAASLEELVKTKSISLDLNKKSIQDELSQINTRIIRLEEKKTAKYQKHIADSLKKLQEHLERHDGIRPKEVQKPTPQKEDKKYQEKLEKVNTDISSVTSKIDSTRHEVTEINTSIVQTNNLIASLCVLVKEVQNVQDSVDAFFANHDLSRKNQKLELKTPIYDIELYLDQLNARKLTLQSYLDGSDETEGFSVQLARLNEEKKAIIETANNEEKLYQKYLLDLKEWEEERNKIIGEKNEEGSLRYFENESDYLKTHLDSDYQKAKQERNSRLDALFFVKTELAKLYESIYAPVETEIDTLLGNLEDQIKFSAEIQLKERTFSESIFSYINAKFSGKFRGKEAGQKAVDTMIKTTDFSDRHSLVNFIDEIMEVVDEDIDNSAKKISSKQEFYDYLYGLDYLDVFYKLQVGSHNLEELSPGERGIVLLIFYLALSKSNTPIIIDQPEDNLDNQSVYNKLVPCICAAKARRQVIIVTHNPNIAVACDAEQLIYCNMDKVTHSITYESGGIENPCMKQHVIDVLEGTMPAFDLRRRKYTD